MPTYTLNIDFDAKDLPAIYQASEQVTLLKRVDSTTAVAWVAFRPFENNSITWTDDYALYASTTTIEDQAIISKLSDTAAAPEQDYRFVNGEFSTPTSDPSLHPGQYKVINGDAFNSALTFGMAQSVQTNGTAAAKSPINAATVPMNQSATFLPKEVVTVFLMFQSQTGMVIFDIVSNQLDVTFSSSNPKQTVRYDASIGGFVLADGPSPALLASDAARAATIQVYDLSDHLLGSGPGTIGGDLAEIERWTNQAAVQPGKQYKLRSSGKHYTATCDRRSSQPPVAEFKNVA